MNSGYIKIHRKILDNPVVMKDSDHLSVWIYLLLHATHKEMNVTFGGKKIILKPGQLITGARAIAKDLKLNKDKIQRILNEFKSDTQIDTQKNSKGRLITLLNWDLYQNIDTQNNTILIHNCDTTDTQVIRNNNERINSYYCYLERIIGPILSPYVCEQVDRLVEEYGGDMFLASAKNAAMNNVKNLKYIESTLKNWKAEGKVKISEIKKNGKENQSEDLFDYDWLNEGDNG